MENNNLTLALTPELAAKQLHCCVHTVYTLIKENRIPYVKLSRRYLISSAELAKWLAGNSTNNN